MFTVFGSDTSLKEVMEQKCERPERAGRYWQGVSHKDLVLGLYDEISYRGWMVTEERYALSKSGSELAGALTLDSTDIDLPDGQTLSLGFLNSNAMKRSLRIVVGTNVVCCNNGMCTGEIVMARKHTKGMNLFDELAGAMNRYVTCAKNVKTTVAGLREAELSSKDAEHILMDAGRQKMMPWSRIGEVDAEYREPRFKEHGEDTSWALLNAFTYVVKKNPPLNQMGQINSFRALLPSTTA